ncbi:MAG: hypothetical protein JRF59_08685 [Deltaproteobacteria bacterium]|nr:hypothetical protein [Deltaproteobacteria bacterium]MBW1924422.1 hypothetical protein [Deltaproteobacteria bacterium]MBW1948260.1 hypothetical protein [Deltaproteobacteria bacterium]MBW2007836.1 hypothetical protein [Deltaproteobacteria bacterium]MBW2101736.1 hypothetical protein [Deltaproteobacteria bacterium]
MGKDMFAKGLVVCLFATLGMLLMGHQALGGTRLKTEPATVVLAPKAMAGVKIIGSGFKPEDRVEIVLAGADKGRDVPVAFAEADASGAFTTKMNILSILQGFFHFRFKKGKPTPDPKNPPLPPGEYTLKAKSWDSKLVAACKLVITAPKKK